MREAFGLLSRAAAIDATLLIEGETGTGKDGAAYAVHRASARRDGPFVVVDCGAIAANLIESELFGHEKGAFTDAVERHTGAFEQAHGGTVFLDEIGELPLELQPKLLRVLEQKTVRRVGSSERIDVDVRIIAATNRELRRAAAEGRFRTDLYFRLNVLKVVLPPLRRRSEDILPLTRALLSRAGARPEQLERLSAPDVIARLSAVDWPGNVRELRNYLERCVVLDAELELSECQGDGADPLPVIEGAMRYTDARKLAISDFEKRYLTALLNRTTGNVSQAAREAGIDRVYLHRLLRRHGLKSHA
jgi:DNA-binding NtrC family response regulator